jgi:cobalt-zinc-cadmium efflux system protein
MLVFAVVGFGVNLIAVFVTRGGESLNQRAVNLHMLEDVLGWAVVLVGSVVIKLTGLYIIDPIMSVGVSLFVLFHAVKSFRGIIDLFLERVPDGFDTEEIKKHLLEIEGVIDIHHIHLRSFDGESVFMSLHAVIDEADPAAVKRAVREELKAHGIAHCTVETEAEGEECGEIECVIEKREGHSHHGHHH